MRVAYLMNLYPHVTHSFIRREIAAVERRGVEIERVSIRARERVLVDAADVAEAERTRVVLGAGVVRILGALVGRAFTRPRAFVRALRLAMHVGRRSPRGRLRHLAYVAEACAITSWLETRRVDHVHAHFGTNPATVAMLCRVLGGPPYSFTVHGAQELTGAAALALDTKMAHAAFAVAVSTVGQCVLGAHCVAEAGERIHLIHCGVDPALRHAPPPFPAAARLVFVGRLDAGKNPLLLLDAAQRVAADGERFELVIVGDGPLRSEVEDRIDALGLRRRVTLTGWVDGAGTRRALATARALVLPSRAEGLPVVVMEALALGRPAIVTDVGAVAELIEPGVTGWLVPSGSVDALAAAMRDALRASPEVLARMGRAGAVRVHREHDPDVEAGRLVALFEGSARAETAREDAVSDATPRTPAAVD